MASARRLSKASGSQHKTMSAISHRMARSLSVSTDELGHVADGRGFGVDPAALG
jgi:hypothetical protein